RRWSARVRSLSSPHHQDHVTNFDEQLHLPVGDLLDVVGYVGEVIEVIRAFDEHLMRLCEHKVLLRDDLVRRMFNAANVDVHDFPFALAMAARIRCFAAAVSVVAGMLHSAIIACRSAASISGAAAIRWASLPDSPSGTT